LISNVKDIFFAKNSLHLPFGFLFFGDIDQVLQGFALEEVFEKIAGFFPDYLGGTFANPVATVRVFHAIDQGACALQYFDDRA
jgi:hypothetical protein